MGAGYRARLTHESNEDKRNALLQVRDTYDPTAALYCSTQQLGSFATTSALQPPAALPSSRVRERTAGEHLCQVQVCLEYLERYYVLIAFASYLLEPSFDAADPGKLPFGRWKAQRPELHRYFTSLSSLLLCVQGSCQLVQPELPCFSANAGREERAARLHSG